jgi:hypothetical protein
MLRIRMHPRACQLTEALVRLGFLIMDLPNQPDVVAYHNIQNAWPHVSCPTEFPTHCVACLNELKAMRSAFNSLSVHSLLDPNKPVQAHWSI